MAPRIDPKKKEEKERVARALLRAALRLSAEHGFASLGLREVARAAEIAPTSFYRHFADMEELGLALVEQLAGARLKGWVERLAQGPGEPDSAVGALLEAVFEGVAEDPELMRFIVAERVGAMPALRAAIDRKLSLVSRALAGALDAEKLTTDTETLSDIADGAIVLLLEACRQALDGNPEDLPLLRQRLLRQLRLMVSGARKVRDERPG